MNARAALFAGLAVLATAGTAAAVVAPGRTQTRPGPIQRLALTHASVAFAVGRTSTDCDHVELWNPDTKGTWRFGAARPCENLGSTGTGIADVAAAGNRAVWIWYTGGNLRDWLLYTATTTRSAPRRLRFVERDVEAPAPIVLGPGTARGVPYAVDAELVYLGASGARIFTATLPARARLVTAGPGPGGIEVAAILDDGQVLGFDGSGSQVLERSVPGASALALGLRGILVQTGSQVVALRQAGETGAYALPAGATMLDYAEGRLLYVLRGSIRARRLSTGRDQLLLSGTAKHPVLASLDAHGLAWAAGRSVHWLCAACLGSASPAPTG